MPNPDNSSKMGDTLRKFPKIGYGFLFCLILFLGAYGFSVYRRNQQTPVVQLGEISKALYLRFKVDGSFPNKIGNTFEGKPEWKLLDERTFERSNYVYTYHLIKGNQCVLWATPKGELRDLGYTHFILVSPETVIVWRGPLQGALDSQKTAMIPVPDYPLLSRLGMGEVGRFPTNGEKASPQ